MVGLTKYTSLTPDLEFVAPMKKDLLAEMTLSVRFRAHFGGLPMLHHRHMGLRFHLEQTRPWDEGADEEFQGRAGHIYTKWDREIISRRRGGTWTVDRTVGGRVRYVPRAHVIIDESTVRTGSETHVITRPAHGTTGLPPVSDPPSVWT